MPSKQAWWRHAPGVPASCWPCGHLGHGGGMPGACPSGQPGHAADMPGACPRYVFDRKIRNGLWPQGGRVGIRMQEEWCVIYGPVQPAHTDVHLNMPLMHHKTAGGRLKMTDRLLGLGCGTCKCNYLGHQFTKLAMSCRGRVRPSAVGGPCKDNGYWHRRRYMCHVRVDVLLVLANAAWPAGLPNDT